MPAKMVPMTDPIMVSWGRHLGAKGRSPGTIRLRQRYVLRMLDGRNPTAITTEDIEEWLSGHPRWAPATRRSAITSIRVFYRWWSDTGHAGDPAMLLQAPGQSAPCPKPCPDDVYAAALARTSGERWWLLRIAGSTGLRRAELASLHSDCVEGNFVRIRGKGSKVRKVPVQPDVRRWLLDQRGWAFPSPHGGHVQPDAIGKRIARALGSPWTAHTLRHRYATVTYRESGRLDVVQRLLGHSSLETTQRYLATGDEDLIDAVAWTQLAPMRLVG